MPQDNDTDALDDILLPKEEPKEPTFDSKELTELKEQLSQLEKEKQGLLKGVQDERRKRQELKGRMDQVTTTLNGLMDKRDELISSQQTQNQKDQATLDGIQVEFTEDGDPYIPNKNLESLVGPYKERIDYLEQELNAVKGTSASQQAYNQTIEAIVGAKPEYSQIHRGYRSARAWVNEQVKNWSLDHGVNRMVSSGEVMKHIAPDLIEEFNQRYPNYELADVVTAEDSEWHLERMLENTLSRANALEPAPKSRLRKVMSNKPSSLGKSANAKGGELSIIERVGNLSATDLMNMDDAQAEALSRAIREDEEKDGINW